MKKFLVKTTHLGIDVLLFLDEVPSTAERSLDVTPVNVHEFDHLEMTKWPDGASAPEVICGYSKEKDLYRIFKYRAEMKGTDFSVVPGMPLFSWEEFIQVSGAYGEDAASPSTSP